MTAYKIERNTVKTTKQGQVITYPCFTLSINSFKKSENKAIIYKTNKDEFSFILVVLKFAF